MNASEKIIGRHPAPNGWKYVLVGDVGTDQDQTVLTGPFGTSLGKKDFIDSGTPVLTISCLTDAGINVAKAQYVSEEKASDLEKYRLRAGDILFSRMASVGRAGFVLPQHDGALFNYHIMRLRIDHNSILPKYFIYYVRGAKQVRDYLLEVNHGATRDGINTKQLLGMPLAIPPLAQQQRIVAEIEKQFSCLDEAVANLKRVKANLKRYKAAVLKAAVEGKLTEEWRKAHPDVEPASKLLDRILAERRAKWEEAELAKMEAKGKAPKNDKWKAKYKEPASPDITDLKVLPEGWVWATVEQLNLSNRPCAYGVLQPGDDMADGIPFVRVGDIDDGRVDLAALKRISPRIAAKYPRTKLFGGEFLITLVGAIGRTALVPETLKGANVARAVGVVPLTEAIDAHWVEIWFRNPAKVLEMTSKSHEVARKTLNLEDVRAATVAVPPLAEQYRIVAEVDGRLSLLCETEAQVDASLQRAERLRKSILGRMFSGNISSWSDQVVVYS